MAKKHIDRTNAERFISAYNQIDHSLRTIYGFKRSISFADLVRKAVPMNSVVRKYEDELIDYGRLRNSIVHKTNPNYVIAEPHDEVVDEFEKIARLIATPPTALARVCRQEVLTIQGSISVKQVLETMAQTGYKNIPVYENDCLQGVVIGSKLLDRLGHCLIAGENIFDFIKTTTALEIISTTDETSDFRVSSKNLTIEQALNYFYLNRRLQIIIITENGTKNERPLGVVTAADILDMNEVLENY